MGYDSRFAAIDLGSNSFHLIIASVKRDGHYRILRRQRQKVRLADGFNQQLTVSEEAIQRGLECLAKFSLLLQDIAPERIRCVATATLRKASNREQILPRFEQALGYPISVIPGETEAQLIYQGANQHLINSDKQVLVLDIGGASTEIIVGTGLQPQHLVSLDMGCVTWQNRFFGNRKITAQACQAAIAAAALCLQPHQDKFRQAHWQQVSGASGTFRTLYDIANHQQQQLMSVAWIKQVMEQAIALGTVNKLGRLGIRRDRQQVFMGGLCILMALLEGLEIDALELAAGALREGLLVSMLTNAQPIALTPLAT